MSTFAEQDPVQHLEEARRILSRAIRESAKLTPREQAEAAHQAGGLSVDELERMVIAERARDAA